MSAASCTLSLSAAATAAQRSTARGPHAAPQAPRSAVAPVRASLSSSLTERRRALSWSSCARGCSCAAHCTSSHTNNRQASYRRSSALRAAAGSSPEPETKEDSTAAAAEEKPTEGEESPAEAEAEEEPTHPMVEKLVEELSASELSEEAVAKVQPLVDELSSTLIQKEQLLEQSLADIDALKDQCLRLNADFDNFRKRTSDQAEQQKQQVKGNILEDLLPVVDNFELAKQQLKLETDAEKKVDASYQGLYKQLVDTLAKMGLTPVQTVGQKFDPNLMDAIQSVPTADAEEGTVLTEFRMGFKIGDRLLRPAMVQVATALEEEAAKESQTVDTTAEEK